MATKPVSSHTGHNHPFYCNNCNNPLEKIKRCAGCHFAIYCNAGCQTANWEKHKGFCWQATPLMKTLAEAYAKKDLADMIKDPVVDAYEELDAFSCIYGGMFGVFNKAINAACKDPNASENISIRINQSMHRSLEALSNAK